MNTNLRALIFASVTTAVVAAASTITLDSVVAAERPAITRLDAVQVTGHRADFDADGDLKVIRLESINTIAHRANVVAA